MRFVLEPGGDLEVAHGVTVALCRPGLVALTGDPAMARVRLAIDGRPLAEDHPAGVAPWVQGSVVEVGTGHGDPVATAAVSAWHLAVVAGPDAGSVAAPARDGSVRIGRGTPARGRLALTDPAVSREHARVRCRTDRHGERPRWVVVEDGSVNGTVVERSRRTRRASGATGRRVPARGRRLRPDDFLVLGATRVVLRCAAAGTTARPHESPAGGAPPLSTWAVPLVGSLALALITRNPVFLAFALIGPLTVVLPAAWWALRRRAAGAPAQGRPFVTDPATLAIRTAAPARRPGGGKGDHPPDRSAQPWSAPRPGTEPVGPPDGGPAGSPQDAWWDCARHGLAVTGPPDVVRGTVRALMAAALADPDLGLTVLTGGAGQWHWLRWLDGSGTRRVVVTAATAGMDATPSTRHLLVVDGRLPAATAAAWLAGRPERAAVVIVDPPATAPSWCRWGLHVGERGPVLTGPDGTRPERAAPVSLAWAEDHARRIARSTAPAAAGMTAAGRSDSDPLGNSAAWPGASAGAPSRAHAVLPERVGLAELLVIDSVPAVLAAWGPSGAPRRLPGLVATLGRGPQDRSVSVDLLTEGPHALVAGTTGAGKSELLQSLILALALRHPPSELAVVLVDYKGGASFGACRDLPHVVGQVTDLDPGEALRALHGVRAELRRRERLLAGAGLADVEQWRAHADRLGRPAPPRLLVVVDELRALSEDLPDFVPGLVRVAAQGRSLGIHLVLATQRPAGAVTAEMRANVSLRLCLRVTAPADSIDVLDVPDAAYLARSSPGRAVLRRGSAMPEVVQTAWAALSPTTIGGHPAGGDPVVRSGRPWPASPSGTPALPAGPGTDHTARLVELVQRAAVAALLPAPEPVWLPPLPARVTLTEVAGPTAALAATPARAALTGVVPGAAAPGATSGDACVLGVTDLPAQQARGLLRWTWGNGPLVVAGRPGSGRTTALRTVAHGALSHGRHVHVVTGGSTASAAQWPIGRGLGTVAGADDPRRVAALLVHLLGSPVTVPTVLVVDDVGAVARALELLPRGAAAGLLESVVREGRSAGIFVAVSGVPADLTRLLPHAAERLVLGVGDTHDDILLGAPAALAGGRRLPGQALHLAAGQAVRCQVAIPPDDPVDSTGHDRGGVAPVRIAPLPLRAALPRPARSPRPGPVAGQAGGVLRVHLGTGGHGAAPVVVDVRPGLLVVGPRGSGRSTTLVTITTGLLAEGHEVLVIARAGPLTERGHGAAEQSWRVVTPAQALQHLTRAGARPSAVVVDDADGLAAVSADLDALLSGWVALAEAGDLAVPRVVAAARTDRVAAAFRGHLAALRASAPVVVLAPASPGSPDVAGADLALHVDPVRPRHPGRGVLVVHGDLTAVQVAAPEAAGTHGRAADPPAAAR